MGLLTPNNISKEMLKAGDHIYSWRNAYLYAHHGIYVGDEMVIHFTPGAGQEIEIGTGTGTGTGTMLDDAMRFSSMPIPPIGIPCPRCGGQPSVDGVMMSCLECFLCGHDLYRYQYSVSVAAFLGDVRGGTCTRASCDPPEIVLHRAHYLLKTGFGVYHVTKNNCEAFALYCKTSLLVISSEVCSGQASTIRCAGAAVVNQTPNVGGAVANSVARGTNHVGLVVTLAITGILTCRDYCDNRLAFDIGRRSDAQKVPVEQLHSLAGRPGRLPSTLPTYLPSTSTTDDEASTSATVGGASTSLIVDGSPVTDTGESPTIQGKPSTVTLILKTGSMVHDRDTRIVLENDLSTLPATDEASTSGTAGGAGTSLTARRSQIIETGGTPVIQGTPSTSTDTRIVLEIPGGQFVVVGTTGQAPLAWYGQQVNDKNSQEFWPENTPEPKGTRERAIRDRADTGSGLTSDMESDNFMSHHRALVDYERNLEQLTQTAPNSAIVDDKVLLADALISRNDRSHGDYVIDLRCQGPQILGVSSHHRGSPSYSYVTDDRDMIPLKIIHEMEQMRESQRLLQEQVMESLRQARESQRIIEEQGRWMKAMYEQQQQLHQGPLLLQSSPPHQPRPTHDDPSNMHDDVYRPMMPDDSAF